MSKFINITPCYYSKNANKIIASEQVVSINIDYISKVFHPFEKYNQEYYEIWFKGESHQDSIKTFDDVIGLIQQQL